MNPQYLRLRLAALLLVTVTVMGACRSEADHVAMAELPAIKAAPSFSFTNFDGRTVTDHDLSGKVYIAYFFFTSCGGPCPVMNSTANVLQAQYADEADFRIVGFSVDPDNDTVEALQRYAVRYNARPGVWSMLRNEKAVVADLAANGFMMGDADVPAMHSTRFALVDRRGMIRGYYDGMDSVKVDELRTAITQLLREDA
ncbi:MAG: SCO family protein [Bacteroidota bacterium]|jgi:protein SCO1/2|nr:SCO family protein [Bacteroidota bacterium]